MNHERHSETTLERVFREISSCGETSMQALARRLRIKPSTLEKKVRALQQKGLIYLRGGRKEIELNADFGYVVGIDMGASHLHFALADFRGELLNDSTERIRPEDGPRKMIAQIKEGIRGIIAVQARHHLATGESPRRPSPLQGIAIGVPSPVDPKKGLVAFANNLPGWKDIHLARELERGFRVPVFLENDANMAAIGEHWRGVARGVDHFVFIALGTGIGSGIFVDGKLYRGRTGAAGELYRMNVEWQRWAEDFGDIGYFESHVSGLGIAAAGRKVLGSPPRRPASSLADERDAYFVFEAMRQRNPKARAVLEKVFTMLGVGVANIVAVLDPALIVFGGGVVKGAPELLLSTVNQVVSRIQTDGPPIKRSSLGDKAQTHGAIFSGLAVAREAIARRLV